jgi:hypothetical protein
MTTDPNADLIQFILPPNETDAANLLFGVPRPIRTTGNQTVTTFTAEMYNAVTPYRLPYRVVHDPDLPLRMITALRSILQNTQPINITKISHYWEVYRDFEQTFVTNGSEAQIKDLSNKLLDVVCGCFKTISKNQRIKHESEFSRDGHVKTDHAILTTDAAAVEDWQPVVIVEDKAMSVMDSHLGDLLSLSPDTFRVTTQLNWERAPSIVAKVRAFLAYQTLP